ncbi:MAG: GNAT family N-acetyltransferase [Actinobacteria bacterium]|nr:MAG: GNAT family N-acetyltransferase [Actinomycetota bacterium]
MAIEIRNPSEDEWRAAMLMTSSVFGDEPNDDELERHRKMLVRERFYAAYDGDVPVGTAADFPFRLTVPGGELAAGGVTWVAVLPSHRRQGVLTKLMRRELDDLHERGDPLAVLWASEAAIYGRFGYGMAAPHFDMDADRSRFALRDDPGPRGKVRMVSLGQAVEPCMEVYERVRPTVPGFVGRNREWWETGRLADPEQWRRGASPKYVAVIELDGEPSAYAIYRVKSEWESGFPKGHVRVVEGLAATAAAERELWRFLFGIDLTVRVESRLDPASPLFLMVVDARSLQLRASEGLWLRLVDVGAALEGRSYASDDEVVVELRDAICPWNAGRWRLGRDAARTAEPAELELDVSDLACVYLGAFDFSRLAAAERVRELKQGALASADALFRTPRPPYCPEDF